MLPCTIKKDIKFFQFVFNLCSNAVSILPYFLMAFVEVQGSL